MQRRAFVRSTLATAFLAPAALSLQASPLVAAATRRRAQAGPIRLASNENPLGVPDSARRAIIDAIGEGNRYPRLNREVIARLAERLAVEPENVVLGNGSAEILQMTVQAMSAATSGVRVVLPDPTFEQVERYAEGMGAEIVKVPLLPDWSHDLARMRAAADAHRGPVLVFVCNPNNPTGTLTSCDRIGEWIDDAPAHVWFLVDEAYFEFAEDPSYRAFVREAVARPNVVVSRTFSKIYALAGVRMGYGVGHADTMRRVDGFAAGTNINHLASAAALACLDDDAFMRESLEINAIGREYVYRTLDALGIEYLPSSANFVMHRVRGDLRAYINRMREEGINVGRAFPPMLEWNRVSIGLPGEMQAWAGALRRLRGEGLV
jgi:histidinol-phosphate aminotransferase